VKIAGVRALAVEAASVLKTAREELTSEGAGAVAVSGMLAEQLAKELGAGAEPGAVVVTEGPDLAGARAVVRVIAGEPSAEDAAVVEAADEAGIPAVLVQLWPQADWHAPYVLSPFVVECKTGEGFPVSKIATQIVMAVEHPAPLAARIPVLRDPVAKSVERGAVARAALVGLLGAKTGAARPAIALEQVRMLSRLLALQPPEKRSDEVPIAAGLGALTVAASFGVRSLARAARGRQPKPVVDALIAAAGTWALAEVLRRVDVAALAHTISERVENART
jgi:hypothetical protein